MADRMKEAGKLKDELLISRAAAKTAKGKVDRIKAADSRFRSLERVAVRG